MPPAVVPGRLPLPCGTRWYTHGVRKGRQRFIMFTRHDHWALRDAWRRAVRQWPAGQYLLSIVCNPVNPPSHLLERRGGWHSTPPMQRPLRSLRQEWAALAACCSIGLLATLRLGHAAGDSRPTSQGRIRLQSRRECSGFPVEVAISGVSTVSTNLSPDHARTLHARCLLSYSSTSYLPSSPQGRIPYSSASDFSSI